MSRARLARVLAASAVFSGACASQASNAQTAPADRNPSQPYSQSCLGSPTESGDATIAWNGLRNPILSYGTSAVRDFTLRVRHGSWHVLYTSVVGSAPTWRIAQATSRTLA